MELCQEYKKLTRDPEWLRLALEDMKEIISKPKPTLAMTMDEYYQAVSNVTLGGPDAPYMQEMLSHMDRMVDLGPIIIDGSSCANDND